MTAVERPSLHLEFLVEPFVAGDPGPHVGAAVAAIEGQGVDVEVGPFATIASGTIDEIAAGVAAMLHEAFSAGATRVSVVADVGGSTGGSAARGIAESEAVPADADAKEFLAAVRPVVRALGASVIRTPRGGARNGDIELRWRGEVVGAVRPTPLTEALEHLIGQVEQELGGTLVSLDRAEKQQAVALLHERGAFALRRSTDAVAEAMGVSRITIYNYLNALESTADPA